MERRQGITPYNGGQQTNARRPAEPKVPVKFKMAFSRRNGSPDLLAQSLTAPPRELDDTRHFLKRGVTAGGHQYKPHWAPLRKDSRNASKATDYGRHAGGKGSNALGQAMNRVGTKSGWGGKHG